MSIDLITHFLLHYRCDYNKYTIKIIRNIARLKKEAARKELEANADSEDEDMELIKNSEAMVTDDSDTSE